MRQILTMILHCLYIYILVYKLKRNLHYTCKLHKIFELLKRIHYSESIKVTQTDYIPRFRVKFKKKWFSIRSLKFEIPVCYMLTRAASLIVFNVIVLIFLFFGLFSPLLFPEFSFPLTRFLAIDTNSVVDVAINVK